MERRLQAQALEPNSRWTNVIIVVSILVPVLVAALIYMPNDARLSNLDVRFLPHLNAILNSATALCLLVSLWAILTKRVQVHRNANFTAFGLSTLFLISYVIYHYAATHTYFGDVDRNGILTDAEKAAVGSARTVYGILLLTHIVLAAVVVPMVLFSMYYSLTGQFAKHKRLSRFTWPVWFYVAVTGVLVYWLISPYYAR